MKENISQIIRQKFLNFFQKNNHKIIPSSPVVLRNDPTLMFANAGMNQFKDIFLGKASANTKRATTAQKCIRVGGKHNDLDNVGHTLRHLTFFEMLGNFSFGDYFKKEAIEFAWNVTTDVFEYEPEKVWVTVFETDDESFELWTKFVSPDKIVRLGEKDNFWFMGDTGPCGPCTEMLYDKGSSFSSARSPLEDTTGERFLEFWNVVFMQYEKLEDGSSIPLPKKSVDTGAGLERLLSIKAGTESVFETGVLFSLIEQLEKITGITYDSSHASSAAFRVIADHIRPLSFAIADGVLPGNADRGYILRKVARRAVRYGRSLGMNEPFLAKVLPDLVDLMGDDYPELSQNKEIIADVITAEEQLFFSTLKKGGNEWNKILATSSQNNRISGSDAFKLKDTYGLPFEEIQLLAKDAALSVDEESFLKLEEEAKEKSRQARGKMSQSSISAVALELLDEFKISNFVGYETSSIESSVLAIINNEERCSSVTELNSEFELLLDKTPFYAESGGQVSEIGSLVSEKGSLEVISSKKLNNCLLIIKVRLTSGTINVSDIVKSSVNEEFRHNSSSNHTATHLLHHELRKVCGKETKQAGSFVCPSYLRFDFFCTKKLTEEQLIQIERQVNANIRKNDVVSIVSKNYEDIKNDQNICMFFEENYGEVVRVVHTCDSTELCGGIHAKRTGDIGLFKIIKESSVGSGIRRIEAITGSAAFEHILEQENATKLICQQLSTTKDKLSNRISSILSENKSLETKLKEINSQIIKNEASALIKNIKNINNNKILCFETEIDHSSFLALADMLTSMEKDLVLIGINTCNNEHSFICKVMSKDSIGKGVKAGTLAKTLTSLTEGRGGGNDSLAQGKILNKNNLQTAFDNIYSWLNK